jgi:hypothetical protein
MRPATLALGLASGLMLLPGVAQADPVTTVYSSSGVTMDPSGFSANGASINLGDVTFTGGSEAVLFVDGLASHGNYVFSFKAFDPKPHPFSQMTAEILDPTSDGFDAMDPHPQPGYVPTGYSTSNNTDGLSFAWNSGLERSVRFASGREAALFVDENSNSRDMLQFNNFGGGDSGMVTFGLRDNAGGRGFLLRLSVDGTSRDPGAQTPEPASMLLLGTGLAGLALFRHRKRVALR